MKWGAALRRRRTKQAKVTIMYSGMMQDWESDARSHLAFGGDAGAKECEPDGRAQRVGRTRAGGCRAENRGGEGLSACFIEALLERWASSGCALRPLTHEKHKSRVLQACTREQGALLGDGVVAGL